MSNLWRSESHAANIVRDWDKLQGYTHCTDEHIQIRRDINTRLVSIENSGQRPVGIGITNYYEGVLPPILFILAPGDVKSVGINSQGSNMQYISLLDPENGQRVGPPTSFRTDSNQFVLRDGLENWFVQAFQRTAFRPTK